jgi:hypothetical protein
MRVGSDLIPGDVLVAAMRITQSILFELGIWDVSLWSSKQWSLQELGNADEAVVELLTVCGCEPNPYRTEDGQWWHLNFRV